MSKVDYKSSGVDVEAGDALVDWLSENKKYKSSWDSRVRSGIGGFASLFDIQFTEMQKPLLVTCTDGVGTKVQVAAHFRDFTGVGQDLVAMCVNDLLCCGAEPLQFLDYYATGKLNLEDAQAFLTSVRKACAEVNCVLIGGETAEMPGLYQGNDFDCAGFAVGVVDEPKMWGPHRVKKGDALIAVGSSGFHSNGYSLLRKIFSGEYEKYRQWLIEPTKLYYRAVQAVKSFEIHAAAHITGGGVHNIPRVIPENLAVELMEWPLNPAYLEVQKRTQLSFFEMVETLNAGVGFVFIVPEEISEEIISKIKATDCDSWRLGRVVDNSPNFKDRISWTVGG